VTEGAATGQDRARDRLLGIRDSIRCERGEVMNKMGRELLAWRKRSEIKQQDLAAEGCVSATVVRRIEKGDYESAPHRSLISAVAPLASGPEWFGRLYAGEPGLMKVVLAPGGSDLQ